MVVPDMRPLFFVLIVVATMFEVGGDILLKHWSLSSKPLLLFLGLAVYFVGIVFFAFSLRYEYLSKAISVLVILNMVVVALVGTYSKSTCRWSTKSGSAWV